MIKISVREYKAKLSHYLDLLEAGEQIEVRGLIIGRQSVVTGVVTPVVTEALERSHSVVTEQATVVTSTKRSHAQKEKELYNDDGELMCKQCKGYRAMKR